MFDIRRQGGRVEFVVTGNRVRELRTARALSQAELSRGLGVSRQTINSIETGRYTPSLPLAIGLARFFGQAVEEVFAVRER
jgi:putative transcriptional regulator